MHCILDQSLVVGIYPQNTRRVIDGGGGSVIDSGGGGGCGAIDIGGGGGWGAIDSGGGDEVSNSSGSVGVGHGYLVIIMER